ncbi:hypothetical protein Lal_00027240 [Lupinus albus]|nr:hypothetical protein Lal_00027240 [Lupinus albus]
MITLDENLFLDVGGLSSTGSPLGDCELTKVGPLTVKNRLLHYLISYILVQRNTNHAQPKIYDLKLIFSIRDGILNPDQQQAEASHVPQEPLFGLVDLDAMEQWLNERIDSRFQSLNERIYSGL